MKVTVIHLSDIHIKSEDDAIFDKVYCLSKSIKSNVVHSDKVLLITTGDIAFSGKESEYAAATNLYNSIIGFIDHEDVHVLFTPGNHDCNHYNEELFEVRKELISSVLQDVSKISLFEKTILKVQENYKKFHSDVSTYDLNNLLCSKYKIDVCEGFSLDFFALNSAWMSEKKEVCGKIIPYKYGSIADSDANIKICAMHHTPNWFHPDQRREFRTLIESEADFLLTGHEHEFYSSRSINQDGCETQYVEGQVLQDSSDSLTSGYNVIHLDTERCEYLISTHEYRSNIYKEVRHSEEWIPVIPKSCAEKIVPNKKFFDLLQDPGMLYMHPRKKNLTLQDIYLHPDLRDIDAEKKSQKNVCTPLVSSKEILNSSSNKIILGEEKSGRTSLCKQLYMSKCRGVEIPIFIKGSDVKSHKVEDFEKIVLKSFVEQYSESQKDLFLQTERNNIFLIVDDLNRSKLNHKHKCILLDNISNLYGNITITVDELFQIEELVTEDLNELSNKYHFYQIEQFGHLLRAKLIAKWNELGQESYVTNEELTRLNDKAKSTIDTVIGKNYVPSFPFFLITILNSIDDHGKQGVAESSYGYYYDYLITGALKNLNLKNEDIDALYNYLIEFSYKLFSEDASSLNASEISDFDVWYCREFQLKQDRHNFLKMLQESKIIRESNGEYSFRYSYFYYYFLAKYISQHIGDDESREIIKEMCATLHRDESSNVVMFLTHLSKDRFVLDQVLLNSKSIFSDNTPTTLQKDVEIINKLVNELPKIELKERSVEKFREDKLKLRDEFEQRTNGLNDEMDRDKNLANNPDTYSLIVALQKAFKHQEIIGQILKNYYGSLRGEVKEELCNEAFELCLRSLSEFYTLLNDNLPLIIDEVKDLIREDGKTREDKIDSRAKREIFYICEQISYCFFRKISSAIGSDKLEETYKRIVAKNPTVANEMVEIAIKLDFYRLFPIKDVKVLCKKLETNILPYSILKRLVVNYLYMFPTNFSLKQQICDATNISMSCQRAIEATTHQKKY